MHLKKEFITQQIGSRQMMVAVGKESKNFHGIVKSNGTAAFIVDQLKKETTEEQVVAAIMAEYDVAEETAARDVELVLGKLRSIGALAEA